MKLQYLLCLVCMGTGLVADMGDVFGASRVVASRTMKGLHISDFGSGHQILVSPVFVPGKKDIHLGVFQDAQGNYRANAVVDTQDLLRQISSLGAPVLFSARAHTYISFKAKNATSIEKFFSGSKKLNLSFLRTENLAYQEIYNKETAHTKEPELDRSHCERFFKESISVSAPEVPELEVVIQGDLGAGLRTFDVRHTALECSLMESLIKSSL